MAPDADAGKSAHRADPFAPLTSEEIDADIEEERNLVKAHSRQKIILEKETV